MAAEVALTKQQKELLDYLGGRLQNEHELWTKRREFEGRTAEERQQLFTSLVPLYLVQNGDRYRLTLEGALEARFGDNVLNFLGRALAAMKEISKRDRGFEQFSFKQLAENELYLNRVIREERDIRWLGHLIRIAGLCAEPDSAPETGPWHVPEDVEPVLECTDVQALRRLRRGDLHDPTGRIMDPKATLGLEDVHIALLDRITEYELEHAEPTPINHALLAEPPERENDVHERLDVLSAKDCIEIVGFSGREALPLTTTGLLASSHAARADATTRRLLSYFRDRLSTEGAKFDKFTWEDLKTAGVATGDTEFPFVVQVIHLLRLQAGSTSSRGPRPEAKWGVPHAITQLRGVNSISDLLLLDAFKPRERSSGQRQAERAEASPSKETAMTADPKKVFIIHGRNLEARTQMGIFVRSLGLVPINFGDLRASMGGTPTIAEIVERGMTEAQGVIALITADEYAAVRPEYREEHDEPDQIARWQARPNVIFEAGMAFGRARTRVVFVLLGNPKLFTDVAGIHVLRPTNDPSGDRGILRGTLGQGMHCDIELHSSDWMKAGDFEGCVFGASQHSPNDPFGGVDGVAQAVASTAGGTSPLQPAPSTASARSDVELSIGYEKVKITPSCHDYKLVASMRNAGTKRIDDWEMEIELPTPLLQTGIIVDIKVPERSDADRTLFRVGSEKLKQPLRAGDAREVKIDYRIDNKIYC